MDRAAWQAARKFRADYARRLDEAAEVPGSYQATFGKSRRTICAWIEAARYNWIAAGMPATGPIFPPLDRPAEMFAWWVANMKNAAPAVLAELASGRPVTAAGAISSASSREGQGATEAPAAPDASSGETARKSPLLGRGVAANGAAGIPSDSGAAAPTMDLEQAYAAQQRYVAAACRRYDEAARRDGTAVELKVLAEERNKSIETLRKLRADLDSAAREQGRLVSIPELRAELAPMFETVAAAFVRTLRNDVGLPPDRARQLADACFADLRASRFAPPSTAAPPMAA